MRKPQESAVKHFLLGRDVFVTLPTGSGKSLCYYLLPKAFEEKQISRPVATDGALGAFAPPRLPLSPLNMSNE